MSSEIPKNLETNRKTFPSITGAASSKQIDEMAAAV